MKKNSGFTLIEILIVIAIGAILSTAGFLSYNAMSERKDVELSLQELGSTVKSVQRRSVNQQDGARWSMRFTASSTGVDKYEIYIGATYTTSSVEQSYSFNRPVRFSEPGGDRSVDLNFAPVTGKIDNKKVITITHNRKSARAGDLILNTLGLVTERMEDDIVGYWHFDEGSGATTTDASGQGNNGVITGANWVSANSCIAGECLDFDGGSDYIDAGNNSSLNPGSDITMTAWVYWDGSSGDNNIITKENAYEFRVSGGYINFAINPWAWTGGTYALISSNKWHHVVITHDGDGLQKIFIDGVEEFSTTSGGDVVANNNIVTIASRYGGTGSFFGGKLDEVKIYNRALSADEIQRMYNDLRP